uniref:Truncated mat A-1 n=1 Tax=Thermothelomyces fergusii TaxID=2588716 RepID=A0A0M4HFL3_9PEZI|nr:truncated mat A-1 [Thermothelomyces fergusii]
MRTKVQFLEGSNGIALYFEVVFSGIRELLAHEDVTLQEWLQFAIRHMGIVVRESYLTTLGWRLVQGSDGTHTMERTTAAAAGGVQQGSLQPTNGLGLFMKCLNDGLPVSDPLPIIAKLSGLGRDILCVNTRAAARSTAGAMEGFRQLARNQPHLAMSALFQVPAGHPLIAQGVTVHQLPDGAGFPAGEPFLPAAQAADDPELDAMLDRIFQGEAAAGIGSPADFGDERLAMSMSMSMGMSMGMGMGMDMGMGFH